MNTPNVIERRFLSLEMEPLAIKLADIDLDRLRRLFLVLADRASSAIPTARCDQDDTVMERFLLCRFGDGTVQSIPAEYLAEQESFQNSIRGAMSTQLSLGSASIKGTEGSASFDVTVLGAMVRISREQWGS